MTWSTYGSFLIFALVLTVVPGPDLAVVTKNTLAAGRWRGAWAAIGVTSSNVVQGAAAAVGLSALILRVAPLFQAIKWAGVGYLVYLGGQAVRSAVRGQYPSLDSADAERLSGVAFPGWRQGFSSNITNPKVLVFYLAALPQFLPHEAGPVTVLFFAFSHALLGLVYLVAISVTLHRARRLLARRSVRRGLDGATGAVLLGFSVRLATEEA